MTASQVGDCFACCEGRNDEVSPLPHPLACFATHQRPMLR